MNAPDDGPDGLPDLDLTPDAIAGRLGKCRPADFSAAYAGYVSFKGYLGRVQDGVYPVYLDDELRSWILIRAGEIKHRVNVAANAHDPRSVIFVERDAQVTRCETGPAHEIADEAWGVDPAGGRLRPRRKPPY